MARWELVQAALAAWVWCSRMQHVQLVNVEPPHCPSERCVSGNYGQNEYPYTVDGLTLLIEYTDSGYFALKCSENLTLDNSALPRFKSELRVIKVQLKDCPPPRGSYADVLSTLKVVPLDKLKLINAGNLTGEHLAGLKDLFALELREVELAPRALFALQGLRSLFLDNVSLPRDELRHLPTSLEKLELWRMGTNLTAAMLEALPNLVNLTVRDPHNLSVALTGSLQVLALEMPAVRIPSALSPALWSLTVFGWDERWPEPWTTCALDSLYVRDVTAEALPANWVKNCTQLRVLRVEDAKRLKTLDATSLHGASNLQELHLTSCALTALPQRLLDDANKLSLLDLSGNLLMELPSGLFVRTRSLQTLNLAKNRLKTSVFTSLSAVTSLTTLQLSYNDLKDSCGGVSDTVRGMSELQELKKMTNLYLRKTNASLICRDWRENMPLLERLDLSRNNINSVTYADLQFGANVQVNLSGNNVSELYYTRDDYALATARDEEQRSRAVVTLDDTLACDCHSYWAARALRDAPSHVQLRGGGCAGGRALRAAPLDELVCAAPELCARAPPACACATRDSGAAAPARVLRVRCERAGVQRLERVLSPLQAALARRRVSPDDFDWQLHLANNSVALLSAADLPKHLSVLDLSYNSLSVLSTETARALVADERRRVLLAHNPLVCDCSAADALAELRARRSVIRDYLNATCADRSPLSAAPPPDCTAPRGPGDGLVAASAALVTLLAAAALLGLLWHPARRRRLKEALQRCGWPVAAEPEDDERRFDVFLSFSHGDERFVREELVARLESGPAPYRLCVHYRDWAPGGWIPAQIAASVRASRRTVAVVSNHFLRSAWARAEFQEAYALALRDARPRLVVVLLDDPAALPLDDRLRRYLATNTYVRWGDPWFWQKLRRALPRGRGPAPPERVGPAPPERVGPAPPERVGPAPPERVGPAPPERVGPAPPERVGPAPPEVREEPAAATSSSAPPSSSSSSSSSPTYSSSSTSGTIELDLLTKRTCGAQCAGEVTTFATPLQV